MNTTFRQLALQAAAAVLVLSLAWPYFGMRAEAMPWAETAFMIGFVAFLLASFTRQPVWWRLMHALFVPLAWAVSQWNIDPGWFLLAFIVLLMIYRGALSGRVPLYLTNQATVDVLGVMLQESGACSFLDLGAGVGSTLLPLAMQFPERTFGGVENAPLTWVLGRWRTRAQPNLQWRWGDLWKQPLGGFEVVYAFLSPEPMPQLWCKAQAEMRPGALLISNAFEIPDAVPEQVIELADGAGPLYCYRVAG